MLHGNERRKRHGDGSRGHDGGTNLLGQYGSLDHRGTSADKLRPGPQPLHMANDAVYGRDGSPGGGRGGAAAIEKQSAEIIVLSNQLIETRPC